jgi:hypothetical protein
MNYANRLSYSDVHPFEIVRQIGPKTLEIRKMEAVIDQTFKLEFHAGGFMANCSNQRQQKWTISKDISSPVIRIRLGKNGWKSPCGSSFKLSETPVKFHDYNF